MELPIPDNNRCVLHHGRGRGYESLTRIRPRVRVPGQGALRRVAGRRPAGKPLAAARHRGPGGHPGPAADGRRSTVTSGTPVATHRSPQR